MMGHSPAILFLPGRRNQSSLCSTRLRNVKTTLITAALMAAVFCMALRRPQSETDRGLAEDLLGSEDVQQVQLSDADEPPAFQAGARAALFFERIGMQGLIRGVVVIEDDRVIDLLVLQSHEGLDHDALDAPDFIASFHDLPAKPPLIVDAVSGATISSQAVTDAVNARLAQWVTYIQREKDTRSQE
jgi:hypothetical protein